MACRKAIHTLRHFRIALIRFISDTVRFDEKLLNREVPFQKWCARKSYLVTEGQQVVTRPFHRCSRGEKKKPRAPLYYVKNVAVLKIITTFSLRLSRYCTHVLSKGKHGLFWKSFLFIFTFIFKRSINLGGTLLKWNDLFLWCVL